ncbi:hypothetical protein [Inquilinus sp.]|uniref:hypothetical protein n=1 Tax=Inquilinus sp. TaxID=1932117 RepID=UPI0031E24201
MSLWQTQVITIQQHSGFRLVDAEVFGCFAVHLRVGEGRKRAWRITHVPTGLAIGAVIGDFSEIEPAKRAAEALARRFNDAALWGGNDATDHRDLRETVRQFVDEKTLAGDVKAMPSSDGDRSISLNGYQFGAQ